MGHALRPGIPPPDHLSRRILAAVRAERGAEPGVLAADGDLSGRRPDGNLAAALTDADILRVRALQLADAEREVLAQVLLLLRRQLSGRDRSRYDRGEGERANSK